MRSPQANRKMDPRHARRLRLWLAALSAACVVSVSMRPALAHSALAHSALAHSALAHSALAAAGASAESASAALTVSKQAFNAYRAKRYKDAAALYRAAWHTHRSELRYLYNAARAAQLAGLLENSQRDYVAYVMKAPGESSAMRKARVHLEEVRGALRAQRTAMRRVGGERQLPPAPATGAQRTAGWVLLVAGAAVGVAGGVVLVGAMSAQDTLNKKLTLKDTDNKIIGISKSAADTETTRLNKKFALGWGLAGAGVVGLGVGALLLATAPTQRVTLAPWSNGRGALLTIAF